jgi:hypothetical protein
VALPPGPDWPRRLELADLDVITTGRGADQPNSWQAAVSAVPHRPAMALAADVESADGLVAAGCRLICTDVAVAGHAYRFVAERCVVGVDGLDESIEDASDIAARVLTACEDGPAAELWVVAGPGLSELPLAVVEAKLRALTEGARQARLWLAKEQFDRDWGPPS